MRVVICALTVCFIFLSVAGPDPQIRGLNKNWAKNYYRHSV